MFLLGVIDVTEAMDKLVIYVPVSGVFYVTHFLLSTN